MTAASRQPWDYLDGATRARKNLTISPLTHVTRLLFDGTRCVGIVATIDGKETGVPRQGDHPLQRALHSPAHLLRAGIGPVGNLREMGIPCLRTFPALAAT